MCKHFDTWVDSLAGTSVWVYGSVSQSSSTQNSTTVSTYQVDGGSTVTYTAPVSHTSDLIFQEFFKSTPLEHGQHFLLITVTEAEPSAKYWLDYFVYNPGGAISFSSPSTSSADSASSVTHLSPDSSRTSHGGVDDGTIAAAVVGGVFGVLLLIAGILWWRMRKAMLKLRPRRPPSIDIEGKICFLPVIWLKYLM